jgi:curved DNA-binding protein CbpA
LLFCSTFKPLSATTEEALSSAVAMNLQKILFDSPGEDYYAILNCNEHSTKEQIIAEFRRRSLECHPDRFPGDETKYREFIMLKKAYDVLKDDNERKEYDKWRRLGIQIPYEMWRILPKEAHSSIHWRPKDPEPLRLKDSYPAPEKHEVDPEKKAKIEKEYQLEDEDPNSLLNQFLDRRI